MVATISVHEDPLFVTGDCCNYELDEYSPCIDVGNPGEVTFVHDYCGNPRVAKGNSAYRVDMGAVEYGASGLPHEGKSAIIANNNDLDYSILEK